MNLKLPIQLLVFSYVTLWSVEQATHRAPAVFEGKVISNETAAPVVGAHVFIIKGEEEALTGSDGSFRITSWQQLPFTITIEHKNYQTSNIRITEGGKKQLVKLKLKSE